MEKRSKTRPGSPGLNSYFSPPMLQRHFRTLGIEPTTDKKVIKNAYRKLAKKYHPDISQEPDAHDRFVEISLAYDKILERLDRPIPRVNRSSQRSRRQQYRDHIRKQQRKRADHRKRAEKFAGMKYRDFEKAQPKAPPFPLANKIIFGFCALMFLYPVFYGLFSGQIVTTLVVFAAAGGVGYLGYLASMYIGRQVRGPW